MRYISLFAGIGGFDLALNRQGHQAVYVNEWDKYAVQTYEKNFAEKVDTRSITDVPTGAIPSHDIIVGGFPCQSFSVAGKRRGFEDTRGTLFYEIARIARDKRPTYLLLENVKGLLSHDNGRTFSTIMWALDELRYECQWQVLNSKNFGVPQNRERVFIIGHLRGTPRPQVFPIRKNAELSSGADGTKDGRPQTKLSTTIRVGMGTKADSTFIAHNIYGGFGEKKVREFHDYSPTIRTPKGGGHIPTVVQRFPLKFLGRNQKKIEGDYAYTVDGLNTGGVLVDHGKLRESGDNANAVDANYFKGLDNHGQRTGIQTGMKIRKLTPIECERLQGFPDNWTAGVSDTQRYKQLGNAVTVNVVEEIIKRFK